jgi:hypothetical protein
MWKRREARDDGRCGEGREHKCQSTGNNAELSTLDQHLLDEPQTWSAERDTKCHLGVAGRGAGKHEVRDV